MKAADLQVIRHELSREGWALREGSPRDLHFALAIGGTWAPVLNTIGGSRQSTVLRPYTTDDAPPRSLSAEYGLGAQPLHTDGAHLRNPPDVIVLHSEAPSETSTVIFSPPWNVPDYVSAGIFTVHANGPSFLSPARSSDRFRFDPVAMTPGDHLALATTEYFEDARARDDIHVHHWDRPNLLLFIDNKMSLHARNAVAQNDNERRIERIALQVEESA